MRKFGQPLDEHVPEATIGDVRDVVDEYGSIFICAKTRVFP
jgi:hypothetical protein